MTLYEKIISLVFLSLFFVPLSVFGAISFEYKADIGSGSSGSVTPGTFSNGLAVVALRGDSDTVTAVTVDGVSASLVQTGTCSGCVNVSVWSAPIGDVSGSVSWTVTGAHAYESAIFFYSGVDQTVPIEFSHERAFLSSNSPSMSVTSSSTGSWAFVSNDINGACAPTGGTNITRRYNTSSWNPIFFADSNGTLTEDVSFTQTMTSSCSQNWYVVQGIISASTGGGGGSGTSTVATSSADTNALAYGIAWILFFLSMVFTGFIWNKV